MKSIIAVLCLVLSCNIFAEDATPVIFDQISNLKPKQFYEIELEDAQPGDQIWTAVYLVGRQNYPGITSKVDFVIDNQGLLSKGNAKEHSISKQLIAENLIQTQQYTFSQFKGLISLIDKDTRMSITDPVLEKTDTIRIYSQVNDWIPEYDTYETLKVKFGIQKPVDFDIVAAYVLVGKGEKPVQLDELNFKNIPPLPEIDPTPVDEQIPAPLAVPLNTDTDKSEFNFNKLEIKILIFIAVFILTLVIAFIKRTKFKRGF